MNEDQIDALSDSDLDALLIEFGDWLAPTSRFLDIVSLDTVSVTTEGEAGDEDAQLRRRLQVLLSQMSIYNDELSYLKFDELKVRYDAQRLSDLAELEQGALLEDRGRFFNHVEAEADFSFWQGMAVWSPSEASALILGKDPRKVNEKAFKRQKLDKNSSPFIYEFFRLREAILRAGQANKLPAMAGPKEVALWASRNKALRSEEFTVWADHFESARAPNTEADDLTTSERHSMYKLILGLAAAHYGYLPKNHLDERNEVYSAITDDINLSGMGTDIKTVRGYLKAAAEWAYHQEIRLSQPAPEKLRGKSRGKRTIP
ncbi:hypothetical protein [Devosia sp.]|uniref:hypothetical protein n=1 Tax=Devosia sp. TaxID=1871048 RepID=UPI0026245AAC|nr:hypothetical protein [Devosia sp.]